MAREPLKLSFKIDPVKAIRNGYSYKEANEMADKMCVNGFLAFCSPCAWCSALCRQAPLPRSRQKNRPYAFAKRPVQQRA